MTNHRLLTVKEVAHLLNVSERTVRRLVTEGHLAAPRSVGGARRWFPGDVRVYLYRLRRGDFEGQDAVTKPAKGPVSRQEGAKGGQAPGEPKTPL